MHPNSSPASTSELALERTEQQLRDLRFLETLQDTLTGCRTETAICSSAAHRITAGLDVDACCLAAYDPIAGSVVVQHSAGARQSWDPELLLRAVEEEHTVFSAGTMALPIVYVDGLYEADDGRDAEGAHVWGVLAVARNSTRAPFTSRERRTLRAAATRIALELERRETALLDNVLDGLLRKTKPIDVYMHSLRELRRFIRYDDSASVMTMQRGMAQLTVRAEKSVAMRGHKETLVDSPQRGRVLRLTAGQMQYLGRLGDPITFTREGERYRLSSSGDDGAPGLWRVLGAHGGASAGSVLCYPLIFGGQVLGILRLAAKRPEAFGDAGRYDRLLVRFARLLSVTLYRSELYHQSDRQLQAIKQIGRTITEPIPVEEVCQQVLQLALRVLHVEVGAVGLLNGDRVDLVAHQGCTLESVPVLQVGDGIAGSVLQTGRSRAVPDVAQEPGYVVFNARVRSELIAPITYNREVIGFLAVESYEEGRFREEDEEVITFLESLANQAAIAIKTSHLHFDAMNRLGTSLAIDPALSTAGLQDLLIEELRDKIEQLGAANERLAMANQAKSDFLARMSHDLRGPLNVIVGLANLLTDPSVGPSLSPEKQQESLGVIRNSGEVLSSLIGNILDLSALEAGKVDLSLAPVGAAATFGYLEAMAARLADEHHRDLEVAVTVHPDVVTINVDEEKFLRVMINLISNAVKFTPSGGRIGVLVTVDTDEGESSRALHVVVSDTGVGIEPQHFAEVFEPFRRLDGTSPDGPRGTGLGLAVVRQLVELHGGSVWVESETSRGSHFHAVFPHALPAAEDGDRPVEAHLDDGGVGRQAQPAGGHGVVLVVEDTDAHMDLMRLAVTSRGYTMHGVRSGEEAIEWLAANRPDVILLDMQLPGIDGFAVAAHVRGRIETHAIPLIAVTADALSANEERARASGCDAYLTKPIDIAALLRTIDAVAR